MKYNNYLNLFTYGYASLHPRDWWHNIKQFFKNIKYMWQRIIKGYADCDTFDIGIYLGSVLPDMLLEKSKNCFSVPAEVSSLEEWQLILEEMSKHFHNTLELQDDIPAQKDMMEAFDKMNSHIIRVEKKELPDGNVEAKNIYDDEKAYKKDSKAWLNLQIKAYEFMEDEKDIALDMLKKYYFHLWD